MLESPRDPASRVFYRVFNSDGTEVEQCGNGARCIAALLYSRARNWAAISSWAAPAGTVRARVRDDGLVSVDMGMPQFEEPLRVYLESRGQGHRDERAVRGQSPCGAARARM